MISNKHNMNERSFRQLFFKMVSAGIIGFVLIMIISCKPVYTESLKFVSKLSDGKKIELNYKIMFEKEDSGPDLQKAMDKIKYALTLVFSKVHSKELVQNGKRKVRNSLLIILAKHFNKEVMDVQVTRLNITPN